MAKNGYVQAQKMMDEVEYLISLSKLYGNVNAVKVRYIGSRGWSVTSKAIDSAENNGVWIEIRHYGVPMFCVLSGKVRSGGYRDLIVDRHTDSSWSDKNTCNRIREIVGFGSESCVEI